MDENCVDTTHAGIPPEENSIRVLNDHDIHKLLSPQTPPTCFDVPNSNRVAHPVSGMLEETLTCGHNLDYVRA